ncbi:MAG: hypothetical protein AABZ06_12860 [Bdellovibrionota bacterium]
MFGRSIYFVISLLLFCSVFVVGCHNGDSDIPSTGTADQKNSGNIPGAISDDQADWLVTEYRSSTIKAEVRSLSENIQVRMRKELARAAVEAITLSAEDKAATGNVSLYRIKNLRAFEHDIFTVPRIFVQSAVFGGRISTSVDAGGMVTLRFPVALVDGLKHEVVSGLSTIALPDDYLIPDVGLLKDRLQKQLGFTPNLSALPACPEDIKLVFGDESLQIKPVTARGVCPLNQLFEVSTKGSREQIRKLIEQDMVSGGVRITAHFRLAPHFVKTIRNVEISSTALREKLYKQFVELPYGVGAGDYELYPAKSVSQGLIAVLNGMLTEAGLSVAVAGAEVIMPLLDDILGNYFAYENCSDASGPCFRLRSEPIISERLLYLDSYDTEKVDVISNQVDSAVSVRGLSNDESKFIIPGEETNDSIAPSRGRRGGLLKPMREGDLIEFDLSGITSFKRQYIAPILDIAVSKLDNPVCVKWGEIPTREETDYSICLEWNTACARFHNICTRSEEYCVRDHEECVKRGVGLCFFCCDHVERICDERASRCTESHTECDEWRTTSCKTFGKKNVPAGPAPCLATENQWSKFWRLSELPSILKTKENLATFDQEALFSGIKLQFSHWEPGVTGKFWQIKTACPLSAFFPKTEQYGDHLKISIRLNNNKDAGCEPFNSWNRRKGREPELTVINVLTHPQQYACGFKEELWNGRMIYTCPKLGISSGEPLFDTYYPRYTLEGALRLPGVKFISSVAGSNQ